MTPSQGIVAVIFLAIITLIGASVLARADDAADRAAWFKSLKQPVSKISCCDVSDCRVVDSDQDAAGAWVAIPRPGDLVNPWLAGKRVPVPDDRVLKDKVGLDGEAYLCSQPSTAHIYCFVPPAMSY